MSATLATLVSIVDNLIRGLTIGGAVGMLVAYRRMKTRPSLDPFRFVTRWSVCGVGIAIIAMALGVLL